MGSVFYREFNRVGSLVCNVLRPLLIGKFKPIKKTVTGQAYEIIIAPLIMSLNKNFSSFNNFSHFCQSLKLQKGFFGFPFLNCEFNSLFHCKNHVIICITS